MRKYLEAQCYQSIGKLHVEVPRTFYCILLGQYSAMDLLIPRLPLAVVRINASNISCRWPRRSVRVLGMVMAGILLDLSSRCQVNVFLPAPRAIRTPILQRKPAALEDLKHYSFSCWKPPLKGALSVEAPARRSKECDREMAKFESSLNGPATQMTWAQ